VINGGDEAEENKLEENVGSEAIEGEVDAAELDSECQ
jgi:hypothetical protein